MCYAGFEGRVEDDEEANFPSALGIGLYSGIGWL